MRWEPVLKIPWGIYRGLLPEALRTRIELGRHLTGVPSECITVERAEGKGFVVLSPHPDDDVIGCGGCLHKHRLAGDPVTVIYLTDGARGEGLNGPPSSGLAARRRREAEEAARVIGIDGLVFLDLEDGRLRAETTVVDRVLGEITRSGAETLFLPFLLSSHPDHVETNRIFASLAARWSRARRARVYAYEVWTPLVPNRLVDITAVAGVKEEAIRRHASQLDRVDYAGAILGLNRFRSMAAGRGTGCYEAFFAAEAWAYARLVREVLGPGSASLPSRGREQGGGDPSNSNRDEPKGSRWR